VACCGSTPYAWIVTAGVGVLIARLVLVEGVSRSD
jgi:hypothetical protein